MPRRGFYVLLATVLTLMGAGAYALVTTLTAPPEVLGSPEETARDYLAAWEQSDLTAMRRLVAKPPNDFQDRHRSFAETMRVTELTLSAGVLKRTGEKSAELPFHGERILRDIGSWPFSSTLHLVVDDDAWKVRWAPETLHPDLKGGGRVWLTPIEAPGVELVTRSGDPLPKDSAADFYVKALMKGHEDSNTGWVVEAEQPGAAPTRLAEFKPPKATRVKTTFDQRVQAAAARALDGVDRPAAIVAVKAGTGEILALADRLGSEHNVIVSQFPPGSAFKVVTALTLLSSGLTPDTQVACPATYTIRGHRSFQNDNHIDRGTISLRSAFAHSCNTTMIEQITRLPSRRALYDTAQSAGLGRSLAPGGASGRCGQISEPSDADWLGADAIGQGSVRVTPLCMAVLAAAVADGTWRAPRLMPQRVEDIPGQPAEVPLPAGPVEGVRSMMRAVVSEGTASSAGLPAGTAGKTGTAEADAGPSHAWFMGYKDDLAFAVLVLGGGSGGRVAAPLAARFLAGM
ncbi:NTF2-like N-terminal transpeptidase domain-containing protein [Sinosporangium album]|uniref:NTF2-like N-terminal transpeptidase domain-containing protein n=1 Tax=Sinosporangium album TaxID=504805 RepID=A0A1G8C3V5_9ACTN|nr:penicillin-binding transpeptidase domain-containing protein [Sinosporangium album]SDH40064.1 NTF2-like N-terminal transpeptidase domain-containing protein [Sinosporangium album]